MAAYGEIPMAAVTGTAPPCDEVGRELPRLAVSSQGWALRRRP